MVDGQLVQKLVMVHEIKATNIFVKESLIIGFDI